MNADDLFKKLGYKKYKNLDYFNYEPTIEYKKSNDNNTITSISFYEPDNYIITSTYQQFSNEINVTNLFRLYNTRITFNELEAIYLKCKELGWNNIQIKQEGD